MANAIREQVMDVYRKRARHYDVTANLYYLIGFREWAYRRKAVQALHLPRGGTVVEIGCGTGLNFPLLQRVVGPAGTIVGVDVTDAMLMRARRRVERAGWTNVELVHCDALQFSYPTRPDGILSTLALSLVPECGEVITRGSAALADGGRFVVLDLKLPDAGVPDWLIRAVLSIVRPFAVTEEVIARRPWETIRAAMHDRLVAPSWAEYYLGGVFLATGSQPDAGNGTAAQTTATDDGHRRTPELERRPR